MKRLQLSVAARQNMPILSFAASGSVPPKMTRPKIAYPKLYEHSAFPGLMLRRVGSLYELLGECNGIYMSLPNPANPGSLSQRIHIVLVGDAMDQYIKRGITWARAKDPGLTHPFSNISSTVGSEARTASRLVKTAEGDYSSLRSPAPHTTVDGTQTEAYEVMGVVCDADWGFGVDFGEHAGPSVSASEIDLGRLPGLTIVKYAEVGQLKKIFTERKQEIFLATAGDAAGYMSRAVDDYVALPQAETVLKVPLMYTSYSEHPWDPTTYPSLDTVGAWKQKFGVPLFAPVSYFTAPGVHSTIGYFPVAMRERAPCVYCGPVLPLSDVAGSTMLADVKLGMLLWSSENEAGTGPGGTVQTTGGNTLSAAVQKSLTPWTNMDMSVAANGFDAIQPQYDGLGNVTAIGGFNTVDDVPADILAALSGPMGVQGYDVAMKASKWICGRAEDICKAEN